MTLTKRGAEVSQPFWCHRSESLKKNTVLLHVITKRYSFKGFTENLMSIIHAPSVTNCYFVGIMSCVSKLE